MDNKYKKYFSKCQVNSECQARTLAVGFFPPAGLPDRLSVEDRGICLLRMESAPSGIGHLPIGWSEWESKCCPACGSDAIRLNPIHHFRPLFDIYLIIIKIEVSSGGCVIICNFSHKVKQKTRFFLGFHRIGDKSMNI
jgi:hypothetical protein